MNTATCLLMNGLGTLIYLVVAKGRIPACLGSSLAFLSPVFAMLVAGLSYSAAQGGFIAFGLIFILLSQVVRFAGTRCSSAASAAPP